MVMHLLLVAAAFAEPKPPPDGSGPDGTPPGSWGAADAQTTTRVRVGIGAGFEAQLGSTGSGVGAVRLAYGPLAMEPYASYMQSTTTSTYPEEAGIVDYTTDSEYAGLGVDLRLRVARLHGAELAISAGVSHAWSDSSTTWLEEVEEEEYEEVSRTDLRRSTSANVGVGVTVPVHPRISVGADLLSHVFTHSYEEEAESDDYEGKPVLGESTYFQLRPYARVMVLVWL